jgi:putative transposase
MGRKQEKVLVRHLTLDELNKKIKKEEKSVRVLERLYFIKYIYKGHSIKEACENVDISEPTGYNWLDLWNKRGYGGLAPNFSGGPKPKLGESDREELKQMLSGKDAWTLGDVRKLVVYLKYVYMP